MVFRNRWQDNKLLLGSVAVIALLLLGFGTYKLVMHLFYTWTDFEDMRHCQVAEDCIPVTCDCTCNGCGGFEYDDIINKKYEEHWHYKQQCKKPEVCRDVCCKPRQIACEQNVCVVYELRG